ncbi:MAG: NAD(P)-dependent oxidoreductase [Legionella sp.]|nr:NAD(P)-dependent oxidoreductase [Legionella sp.]
MTTLVIGGTGFLGQAIVRQLLNNGIEVTILTRSPAKMKVLFPEVPFIIGDLLDCEHLDFSVYQQFINCSGEIHNEQLMRQLHVDSIENLLHKVALIKNAHWIQMSSVGVYGSMRAGLIREDHPFAPVGMYEETKAAAELLIKTFCLKNQITYNIIRPSNVFGCGMPNRSLLQLISMVKRRLFFYIGKKSDKIVMNYVHVDDVAALVLSCLTNKATINQDFIISDQLPLPEFIQIISEELGIKNSFYQIPEGLMRTVTKATKIFPGFPVTSARIDALTIRTTYSTEKAKNDLNFSSPVGIVAGLKKYIMSLYP